MYGGRLDATRFARLGMPGRIWAIAAVHGEAERLVALHARLAPLLRAGDRLVYLGNLLGQSPDVRATVDEALAFRRAVIAQPRWFASDVVFLRGAQEETWQKLLQLQFAVAPRDVLQWMLDHGAEPTLRAYGGDVRQGFAAVREGPMGITRWTASLRRELDAAPGHRQYLAALRRAALTDDGALLLVHAGVDPARSLDEQRDSFWWRAASLPDLAAPFAGFRRVVRGFDPQRRGIVETAHAVSLDAGSGFGGALVAACVSAAGEILESVSA